MSESRPPAVIAGLVTAAALAELAEAVALDLLVRLEAFDLVAVPRPLRDRVAAYVEWLEANKPEFDAASGLSEWFAEHRQAL